MPKGFDLFYSCCTPTVWKRVAPFASLIDWKRAPKVIVLAECGVLIWLSRSLVFFRVVLQVEFKNWCCLAITCKVTGSELLSTIIGINLRRGQNGSWSAVIEPYRQERATVATATSSVLHLMKMASTEVGFHLKHRWIPKWLWLGQSLCFFA